MPATCANIIQSASSPACTLKRRYGGTFLNLPKAITASRAIAALTLSCCTASTLAQTHQQIPTLVRDGEHYQLMVDDSPFLMLGGQAGNSSASNLSDIEVVYNTLDKMHGNTAEIPVSWNLLERQPGHFDFSLVDGAIQGARAHHLRLVFLWFGTAKNATFSYVPDWVKQDRSKYFRAKGPDGQDMNAISPFCIAALQADQHAFAALMKHISEFDRRDHTVILMQVENESGLIRTDRDYSSVGNEKFAGQVPTDLIAYLSTHRETLRPALKQAWQKSNQLARGTWTEIFGDLAPEVFSAWAISQYDDGVAASGKAEYPIPYYVNVALMNTGSVRAGDWPSGGATANVIDIWKASAKHIDIVAPDVYRVDFPEMVDLYDRPDNPLFVPETGFAPYYAPYVFTTLAGHDGLGFSPFGVDTYSKDPDESATVAAFEENYRVLRPLLPLIAAKRYKDSLFPIVLNMYRHEAVAIPLGDSLTALVHFDETFVAKTSAHRAGGIIIKLAPDNFIVAGEGFHIDFAETTGIPRDAEFLTIEQGTFVGDRWVTERVLNGDEENITLPTHSPRILMIHLNRK
jgi:beta-galactosidase GanA